MKYPVDPEQYFVPDADKLPGRLYWWYQDKAQFKLWERLNSLSREELQKEHELVDLLIKKYGNIYFFNPWGDPADTPHNCQLSVQRSNARIIIEHGDNNSGKSYNMAAKFSYELMGWSPFYKVERPKYGIKRLRSFSANFKVQATSSQEHLFAQDSQDDSIGLLPPLTMFEPKTTEYMGSDVGWGFKKQELSFVQFPTAPEVYLEFRSAESSNISSAASAIDVVWLDEDPGETKYNEAISRVFRKGGKVFFSFLILPPSTPKTHYISNPRDGIYAKHQEALNGDDEEMKEIAKQTEFYFFSVEQNESITREERLFYTFNTTKKEAKMRYSADGKWATQVDGELTVPAFDDSRHLVDDLAKTYDPDKTMFVGWDLGDHALVAAQYVKKTIKIMYAKQFYGDILVEALEEVESDLVSLFPDLRDTFHIIPHDGNVKDKYYTGKKRTHFFEQKKWDYTTIYVGMEDAQEVANDFFLKTGMKGVTRVQIDPYEAAPLVDSLQESVKSDKGVRKDDESAHLIDALFKLFTHLDEALHISDDWERDYQKPKNSDILLPRGVRI